MRNLRFIGVSSAARDSAACVLSAALVALTAMAASAQSAAVDTSKIGPKVGAVAPPVSGVDQNGVTRSLAAAAGPKGTMLVFFRSADW